VLLLSAIALHRVGFGFALIVAFSLGLAATITAIGLVAVLARRAFARVTLDGPVVRALPALSALVILVVGIAITARAIPGVV
jgi:ABC-type nickel/cobalt efflux system permease component RcnA